MSYKPAFKATTPLVATSDTLRGFEVGSRWIDTNLKNDWTCVDATANAAVWENTTDEAHGDLTGLANDDHPQYSRTDGSRTFTNDVNHGGHRVTNVGNSVADSDAITQGQVNAIFAGRTWKNACRFLTTANIALTGLGTQAGGDWGAALNAGDRIAVLNQTTASQNGIWVAAAGAWARSTDTITNAMTFEVGDEGVTNQTVTEWYLVTPMPVTPDTTPLSFASYSTAAVQAGSGLTKTGNTLAAVVDGVTIDIVAGALHQKSGALVSGHRYSLVSKTAAYTAALTDDVITGDTTAAGFTITLPTAVGIAGQKFTIKKIDAGANLLTVATTSSQTIDGLASKVIGTPQQALDFVSDGANWLLI